jgi:hypothetical protein
MEVHFSLGYIIIFHRPPMFDMHVFLLDFRKKVIGFGERVLFE